MAALCYLLISACATGLYSISDRMIVFSLRKRVQDAVKSAQSKFANTLRLSMKLSVEFVNFEVILDSFLMYSGNVRDALGMY